jgi:hypothetical protein
MQSFDQKLSFKTTISRIECTISHRWLLQSKIFSTAHPQLLRSGRAYHWLNIDPEYNE